MRLADWLAERPEQSRPALAEVIGRHYAAALEGAPTLARDIGGLGREEVRASAGDWFETAARVALGFAAWASARDLAARALELSDATGLERARRLHLLGEATASAVGVDEALPLLEESLDVYREAGADTAREGIVDAACALGGLLRSQTKFAAWSSSPTGSCSSSASGMTRRRRGSSRSAAPPSSRRGTTSTAVAPTESGLSTSRAAPATRTPSSRRCSS